MQQYEGQFTHTRANGKRYLGTSDVPIFGSGARVYFTGPFASGRTYYLGGVLHRYTAPGTCAINASSTQNIAYYNGSNSYMNVTNQAIVFEAVKVDGKAYGYIPVVYASLNEMFGLVDGITGQHHPKTAAERPWGDMIGRIVSATGRTEEPITIDRGYPYVDLSMVPRDDACYGVMSTLYPSDLSRITVNSLGEGAMWVRAPAGSSIEPGDLICSSGEWGLGMVQLQEDGGKDDHVRAYTVAKAMARVTDFADTCDTEDGLLRPRNLERMSYEELFQLAVSHGIEVSVEGTTDDELRARLREAGVDEPFPDDRLGLIAAAEAAGIPYAAAGDTHPTLVEKLRTRYATVPGTRVAFVGVIYLC